MTTPAYKNFIDALCAAAGLAIADFRYVNMDLVVDGVDFTLVEAGVAGEDGISAYCDFGLPSKTQREQILERLLQVNLAMHGINTPVFMINPDNGHVLLGRRLPIAGLDAYGFLTILAQSAAHARQWRKGFYIQDDRPTVSRRAAGEDARFRWPVAASRDGGPAEGRG
jgi:hypothetical protein